MTVILLVLGILVTGAGIVTIGFGIPINEFSLGNTLIISGTTAFSAGLILIGLAGAITQLTQIVNALRPRADGRPARVPETVEEQAAASGARSVQTRIPIPTKLKGEERGPEPPAAESAPEFSTTAIERLRSSLVRADRKADEMVEGGDAEEDVPLSPAAAQDVRSKAVPDVASKGAGTMASAGSVEALKKPRLDFLFRSKSRAVPVESFDKVWPQRGPRQSEARSSDAEGLEATEAPVPTQKPSQPHTPLDSNEVRPAAILKSGVVDGMAYTLYVDGSIEAQLPQGTVRFGSIAELRAHIENNS